MEEYISRVHTLMKLLQKHTDLYYEGHPVIDDHVYDKMFSVLENKMEDITFHSLILCEKYTPEEKQALNEIELFIKSVGDSRANRDRTRIRHITPLKSLRGVYSWLLVLKFIKDVKSIGGAEIEFVCEPKIDGVAFSAKYTKGILKHVLTRGDGIYGINILDKFEYKGILPRILNFPEDIEIRGEAFIPNPVNSPNTPNKRNSLAGAFMKKEPNEGMEISYKAFSFANQPPDTTYSKCIYKLMDLGFKTPDNIVVRSPSDIKRFYKLYDKKNTEFDTDGIVIKVNDINLQRKLGETKKVPKWAIAMKHQWPTAYTKVTDIKENYSEKGKITPVASFKPVKINGSTLTKASLSSIKTLQKLGLKVGDIVEVQQVGGTVPKIIRIL